MGTMNKGSFKNTKASTRSKVSTSAYNRNAASKFGSNNFGFRQQPKSSIKNIEVNSETNQSESK